jgi:hypothetical protein
MLLVNNFVTDCRNYIFCTVLKYWRFHTILETYKKPGCTSLIRIKMCSNTNDRRKIGALIWKQTTCVCRIYIVISCIE